MRKNFATLQLLIFIYTFQSCKKIYVKFIFATLCYVSTFKSCKIIFKFVTFKKIFFFNLRILEIN